MNKKEGITVFFTTHYMEEAAKVAERVAVIDHGKILTTGTVAELLKKTKKTNLEDAFLALTGHEIRDQEDYSGINENASSGLGRRKTLNGTNLHSLA